MYSLVHNIESALMALIKMASSKRDSWELLLRKQISAGFSRNWRVKDKGQIKNVELKHIYGVSRLSNVDNENIQPVLFFHE